MTREKTDKTANSSERGVALVAAVIILAILLTVAVTVLAFSASEANIAGSDLRRMQTFYATSAAMEKMTNDFSNLFRSKMRPTGADLDAIRNAPPAPIVAEGFDFQQTLEEDLERLTQLRQAQGLGSTTYPRVNIPEGAYAGMFATLLPYKMTSTGTQNYSRTQVKLEREFNNYLVPIFQFGLFSNEDIEIHPGPLMTFNGRIHSNGNLYALRNTQFLSRVTTSGEIVRDVWRSGRSNAGLPGANNVWVGVGGTNVQMSQGSVSNGPNFSGATAGQRGFYPGSPSGAPNAGWDSTSILPANGAANRFGGQVLSFTTGAEPLRLPLELEGNSPAELIKRAQTGDSQTMAAARYQNKAQIRILIDDEGAGSGAANQAGISPAAGKYLSTFNPIPLGGGNALRRVSDAGSYLDAPVVQELASGTMTAETVRRAGSSYSNMANGNVIPQGAGLNGHILIEVVKPDGTVLDVTEAVLSMGITEGEPNSIVALQRPIWAAFVQGSRDRTGGNTNLVYLTTQTNSVADGEIIAAPTFDTGNLGFINDTPGNLNDDTAAVVRNRIPTGAQNQIVPINVYNVREGWFKNSLDERAIYERGMTSAIEINVRNLARWLDGVYDTNLLSGTAAVSTNVTATDGGYVVYVSDRRGDRVKAEQTASGSVQTSNGTVDNEDIYGANGILDAGEDVIDFGWNNTKKGTLQKDTAELPDLGQTWTIGATPTFNDKLNRANTVISWQNPNNYFRRAVRLFNGETLQTSGAAGKLSATKGITIASENMVYIWGSYNTTGINTLPAGNSTLNTGGYDGAQVPASIVCDAFAPLSKTWFDALSAMHPEGNSGGKTGFASGGAIALREADANISDIRQGTAVRAGIIAGTTLSAISAAPGRDDTDSRLSGGIVNYPRFLEIWNWGATERPWSFSGSFIPLFHSTQAVAQWENSTPVIYMPPRRNWSFDETFKNPDRLPPGTPFFQYIQSTGFRQRLRD